MFTFQLTHAGVYREHQPRFWHTMPSPWLVLHLRGLHRLRLLEGGLELQQPGPFLLLGVAGQRYYFETVQPRENYVLMLDGLPVRRGRRADTVELAADTGWLSVPELIPLRPAQVAPLRRDFAALVEGFRHPAPARLLWARMTVAALLRHFVERAAGEATGAGPAAQLRRLLDEDVTGRRSLAELARHCGGSADHLRACFRREYAISPQQYRHQRRVAAVLDLIAHTQLSAKEIAARTGFTYLSHFSAFMRAHAGLTPRAAIKKLRHQQEA